MLRADRAAAEFLGDAVAFDDLPLAGGRAAAVASHRRHDEWLGAQRLEMIDGRLDDQVNVGDAAAAGGDGHALARLHAVAQARGAANFRCHVGGHVVDAAASNF